MPRLVNAATSIKFWEVVEAKARMAICAIRYGKRFVNDVDALHSECLADLKAGMSTPFSEDASAFTADRRCLLQCDLIVKSNGIVLTDVPSTVGLYEFSGLCRCCDVTIKAKEKRLFDVQIVLLKSDISVEKLKRWIINEFNYCGVECSVIDDSVKSISSTYFSSSN